AAVGVNYGLLGDNLPPPSNVVDLYRKENIPLLRLFEPNPDVLNALRGSGLKVSLGVKNVDVTNIAMNGNAAVEWVNTNVVPYAKDVNIGWIAVGNELVSADPAAALITQAMGNILNALNAAQLTGIHVSTAISGRVLGVTYPPSAGDFNNESKEIMIAIIKWLQTINSPLFINVYPYFAFASSPTDIPLNYALFNATNPVIDGPYTYTSLFDAMVDSFYAALDKNGGENLAVVVSETGWPTAGFEPYTSAAIGVNYGFEGDNIPSAYGVIELYMKKHSSLENARAKCRSVNAAKVLGVASPPPAASFSNDAGADMQGIITWLAGTNNPLLINVHPCYVFASNPYKITLDYALFSAKQPIVDGVTRYYSLFEAMVDAVYAASSRVGGSNVAVDQ
uniref:Glucan endo-1,3-beta-D-glucosidase n=1 Tax=Chenopodium quinoa TaxID=63459 RepID=A0A803L085_CHEQI